MKSRVNIYLSDNLAHELTYLEKEYKVSKAYILQLSYKLVNRKQLVRLLELGVSDDE